MEVGEAAQALVSAEASARRIGGEGRSRSARFPARKTEGFGFTCHRSVKKTVIE
jgi:hypothetical protein